MYGTKKTRQINRSKLKKQYEPLECIQHSTSVAMKAAKGSTPARASNACCAGECFVLDTPQLVMLCTL